MEKRIPTLAGILLAIATVGIVAILFEYATRTFSSARGSAEPKNVALTNVSDVTLTVTWFTDSPATGLASIETSGQKKLVAYDERDAGEKTLRTYTGHSVPIAGLQPNTDYLVKILSNGKTYEDNGKPYLAHTGPTITGSSPGFGPAYGTFIQNNQPVEGAIVYLTPEGGQTLSTLVGKSGTWLIPLNLTRTNSLTQYVSAKDRLTETIRIVYNNQETTATTDTLNDSPVPAMELGKSYDFRRQQGNAASPEIAQTNYELQVLGQQTAMEPGRNFIVSLYQPADGASLPTNLPLFQGTGIPDRQVSLVIGITNPLSGTTVVSENGTWQFTPSRTLGQGLQSVTVTSVDQQGKPVAITHTFTILKSGTQVLGVATPSATLTPILTPTLVATPSPTSTLAGQTVPTSGTMLPTILLILFGLAFLGSGAIMVTR